MHLYRTHRNRALSFLSTLNFIERRTILVRIYKEQAPHLIREVRVDPGRSVPDVVAQTICLTILSRISVSL